MIISPERKQDADMRTMMLELALIMARCYQRWNTAYYKDEMDYYYAQAKKYEQRLKRATMLL